ncbi:hypothetical protein IQ273_09325 [Nodosilinea sp. LEGE 07298]|uniref:hypothetical protein n=1 Tax=Nodosilinea sp. LEGE 07298 TaxID=2777970 RepID=UPI00188263D3|nr:hypothetical protein [Nodosilinea sp. LEGE 07298]MBE9109617.1 hypothetical protein [Nodosilinea sp. LEGE 07298]
MHPSFLRSLIPDLACAVSLGLLITATPLGLSAALQFYAEASLVATVGVEDDRGSGRLSRIPAVVGWLSFRGSGRLDPQPPTTASDRYDALAYRGSGRITQPGTTT